MKWQTACFGLAEVNIHLTDSFWLHVDIAHDEHIIITWIIQPKKKTNKKTKVAFITFGCKMMIFPLQRISGASSPLFSCALRLLRVCMWSGKYTILHDRITNMNSIPFDNYLPINTIAWRELHFTFTWFLSTLTLPLNIIVFQLSPTRLHPLFHSFTTESLHRLKDSQRFIQFSIVDTAKAIFFDWLLFETSVTSTVYRGWIWAHIIWSTRSYLHKSKSLWVN